MAKTDVTINGVVAGRLDGRGKLAAQVEVRDGAVRIRLDDDRDVVVLIADGE